MKKFLVILFFTFGTLFPLSSQAPTVAIKQYICNPDDTYNLVIEVYGAGDITTFGGYQVDAGVYEVSSCYDSGIITGLPCVTWINPVCGCNGVTFGNDCNAGESGYTTISEGECTGNERVAFTIQYLPSDQEIPISVSRLIYIDGVEYVGTSTSIQANHTCSQATCLTCHPKSNPLTFNVTQDTTITIEHLMTETTQGCTLSFDRTQSIKELPFQCTFLKGQPSALDSFWVYDGVKGDSCLSYVNFVNGGFCCKPFTPCDDNNSCTYGDYYDTNCNCIGKINTSNKEYSFTTTNGETIIMDNIADSCNVYVYIFYFHWCKPCQTLYESHTPMNYKVHNGLNVIPIMMEATDKDLEFLKDYSYNFVENNPFLNIVEGGETEYLADHCLNSAPTVFVKCPNKDTLLVISGTGRNQTMPEVVNNIINNHCKCAKANDVTISIPSKSANYLDTFSIPVVAIGFQNIRGFQFPIIWDTTKLELIKIHSLNKNLPNFNSQQHIAIHKNGILTSYGSLLPFNLNASDTLYSIQFNALSQNCDSSFVSFSGLVLTPGGPRGRIEIIDNNFNELTVTSTDSKIKLNQTLCNDCTHPDYAPLMALYNSTSGSGWTNNKGWKEGAEGSSCDPCSGWHGIGCTNNRVSSINLDNNNLMGILPNLNLPYLTTLRCGWNRGLSGPIPDFSNTPLLTNLILYANSHIDTIPNFCCIPKLEQFSCGSNGSIIGKLPEFNNLGNVKTIDCQSNELSGNIPSFDLCPKLGTLYLSNNQLTGTIPDLSNNVNLIHFYASNNQLTGSIPDLSSNVNLEAFYANDNQLMGTIPDLSSNVNLIAFSASDNQLTGTIPDLSNNVDLYHFFASNNQLSGTLPNLNNSKLVSFFCHNNKIVNIPKLTLPSLKRDTIWWQGFRVYGNRVTFDDILPNIQYATTATFIYAPQDSIYRDTTFTLQEGESLTIDLDIDAAIISNVYKWYKDGILIDSIIGSNKRTFNNIKQSDAGVWTVRVTNPGAPLLTLHSRKIQIVVDPSCRLRDSLALVDFWEKAGGPNWTNKWDLNKPMSTWYGISLNADGCVECIDMDGNVDCSHFYNGESGNKLTGILSSKISDLSNLKSFNIIRNQVGGTIPDLSKNLSLEFFACLDNQLTGSIPDLSKNENLIIFLCNGNQLTGFIPDFSKNLNLEYFGCDENLLTGTIPDLSNNLKLESFGCSGNLLTGTIPNLSNNLKLEFFSCSGNLLTGTIPDLSKNFNLLHFSCGGNQWSGSFPNSNKNQLTGPIPDLSNNIKLELFSCGDNQLTGSIPNLTQNKKLQFFSCGGNNLTGSIPKLNNNVNLEFFECASNHLTGSFPDIQNNKNLVMFYCNNNKINGPIPSLSLDYLSTFWIGDNLIDSMPKLVLPNLGNSQPPLISGFNHKNNKLTFDDILPNIQYATTATFIYAPQDSIYRDTTFTRKEGENLTIDLGIDAAITTNVYKWYKNGVFIDSITGSNKRLFSNIKQSDAGVWTVRVTNSGAPDLELVSRSIKIIVSDADLCQDVLMDDFLEAVINKEYTINVTQNDVILNTDYSIQLIDFDNTFFKNIKIADDNQSVQFFINKPFFDTLTILYEVCTPDCIDCKQASLKITNETLNGIVLTNIILPNTSGKNATLRFTDEEILKDSELYIFNRNGDRIFHKKDYDNSWNADGYPGGIYYYVLRYRGVDIKKTLTVMK